MSLGENIMRLRSRAGLSQDGLAEKLGVSRQSVSKWETDQSVPELDKLTRLAEIFNVTLDTLVLGRAPVPPEHRTEVHGAHTETPVQAAPAPDPGHRTAGWALIILAAVLMILLTLLFGVGGLLLSLYVAVPALICALICFQCHRRAGIWCAWTVLLTAELYVRLNMGGANWMGLIAYSIRSLTDGFPLFTDDPAYILTSALDLAATALLLALTLRSFRGVTLPRKPLPVALTAAGLALTLAVMPLVYDAFYKALMERYADNNSIPPTPYLMAGNVLSLLRAPMFCASLVACVLLLKKRQGREGEGAAGTSETE